MPVMPSKFIFPIAAAWFASADGLEKIQRIPEQREDDKLTTEKMVCVCVSVLF